MRYPSHVSTRLNLHAGDGLWRKKCPVAEHGVMVAISDCDIILSFLNVKAKTWSFGNKETAPDSCTLGTRWPSG